MGLTKATTSDARRRILETADRLFYAEGVRAVGIDRIIAESGAAKMTLYSHFRSKDDLILAVLQYREEQFMDWFGRSMERHVEAGASRLAAVFATLKEWFETPTFRGCAFINASVELADAQHPGFLFARLHKQRFHAFLARVIEETLSTAAARLAPAIAVLIEGAIVTAVIEGSPGPADVARDAALLLLSQAGKD
jgi:AcrR family transcriptional regulator